MSLVRIDSDRGSWRHIAKLEEVRNKWAGNDCVVVACGPSAMGFDGADRWTIVCNRAVTWCRADFGACFEPRKDREAWDVVKASKPDWVLSHRERDHPAVILTPDKRDIIPWIYGPDIPRRKGDYGLGQSTYFALACAITMGFETIGVIGLDLTKDRYPSVAYSNSKYRELRKMAEAQTQRIVQLNPESRVTCFEHGTLEEVRKK